MFIYSISGRKIGDTFAQALGEGLKHMSHEVVELSDNRLTQTGSIELIKNLKPSVKKLDLSENIIGGGAATILGNYVKNSAIE